jgi:hypothetical protein
MARGKRCPCCGYYMYALREAYQTAGTYVTYVCRNQRCQRCRGQCTHTEKVFEGK